MAKESTKTTWWGVKQLKTSNTEYKGIFKARAMTPVDCSANPVHSYLHIKMSVRSAFQQRFWALDSIPTVFKFIFL